MLDAFIKKSILGLFQYVLVNKINNQELSILITLILNVLLYFAYNQV